MIGVLQNTIKCDGRDYAIRTDYRIALRCMVAFQDLDVPEWAKWEIMLRLLIIDYDKVIDTDTAIKECVFYLNASREEPKQMSKAKLYDWEQDEQMIFSAVNAVANREVRDPDKTYHWWTFLGWFNEIGESMFSTIISIRNKRNKHKKLDKNEEQFYRENKDIIDIRRKVTSVEKANMERINAMYM